MKTQQTHIETYILHYTNKSVHRYFRSLDECIEYIIATYKRSNIEPLRITLPNGCTITYNEYAMSKAYLSHGRIDEQQLIDLLKIPDSSAVPRRGLRLKRNSLSVKIQTEVF
jgi:hypothetical protein